MAKLEIKIRKKVKPLTIKKCGVKIKRRKKKKFLRTCGSCKHYWASPGVEREEGSPQVRMCLICKWIVENKTKCYCSKYDGRWVVIQKVNRRQVRDKYSPVELKIKRRRKR